MKSLLEIRKLKRPRCECGRAVTDGSVFCICCRAEVKRRNLRTLSRDKVLVFKKN